MTEKVPYLLFAWNFDEPDFGELACLASANGFSGRAETWVGRKDLLAFAAAIEAYPLSRTEPPTLSARRWGEAPELPPEIEVVIRPGSPAGGLFVEVSLIDDVSNDDPNRVRLSMPAEYAALPRFAAAIRRMLRDGSGFAVLPDTAEP